MNDACTDIQNEINTNWFTIKACWVHLQYLTGGWAPPVCAHAGGTSWWKPHKVLSRGSTCAGERCGPCAFKELPEEQGMVMNKKWDAVLQNLGYKGILAPTFPSGKSLLLTLNSGPSLGNTFKATWTSGSAATYRECQLPVRVSLSPTKTWWKPKLLHPESLNGVDSANGLWDPRTMQIVCLNSLTHLWSISWPLERRILIGTWL